MSSGKKQKGAKKSKEVKETGQDSETTENEFSEVERKSDSEVKRRIINEKGPVASNFKPDVDDKKDMRNVPFNISVKYENFVVRTVWTLVMMFGFLTIVAMGHFYCVALVFLLNISAFYEILSLKRNKEKDLQVPYFQLVNWYFFGVGVFFFYGKLFSSKLTRFVLTNQIIHFLMAYHNFLSFLLWCLGFLFYVLSLKKGFYRYQFRQFAWTHLTIMLVVAQSSAIINNIYEGLVWFIFPCLLVISNDTFAYIFGFFLGKTRLIELSPKKTWEGFVGGFFSTLFWAILLSRGLSYFEFLICPQEELVFSPFQHVSCATPTVFTLKEYVMPQFISANLGISKIFMSNFQFHALAFSMFASLISPFGGFFASGFKRAIKVKDFADIIPGHGGIVDRMDCQFMMGLFSYLYLHQVILASTYSAAAILGFINRLPDSQQIYVYRELTQKLQSRGLLNITAA